MPVPSKRSADPSGARAAILLTCILAIALAAIIGYLAYSEVRKMELPTDDAGWTVFQLGFEHQRLQLAAETGASLDEVRLRGDIYLSRVMVVRDAPMLAQVREFMVHENLTRLFQSAQETERLLDGLDRPGGRRALLEHLQADSRMIRELMLDMSKLHRRIQFDRKTEQGHTIMIYLAFLEVLLLVLLGLGFFVYLVTQKLRRAGNELAMQLATQDAILKSVDAGIIGLGRHGNVLYSNPHAVALLGSTAESGALPMAATDGKGTLIGHIKSLLREADVEGTYLTRLVHVGFGADSRHYKIRVSYVDAEQAADPAEGAETASRILTVADVTAEQEAAVKREEYDARLVEASRVLAFAAISGGIVHEISQPLAAMRNYVYALKMSLKLRPASEEQRAILDHLGEEIDRATEVVRTVRRMGPHDPQETGTCDIHEAIAYSVRLVTLGSNPLPPITVTCDEENPPVVGSLPMIGQVIVNLLKNALSASSAAGRPGAAVNVTLHGDCAEIAISDFGTGVSADAAKSLFAPFSKSARGGMGLGLSICQRIAQTLGGSLSWENRDSAGAIFTFRVPLAKEG